MIKWVRDNRGWYISEDGRFTIHPSYDRSYGNHWVLYDKQEHERLNTIIPEIAYQKAHIHLSSLKDCKKAAESL